MPTISKKGNNIPPSPIRKLVPFADNAKKNGIDILHLNIGQPDIKSPIESIDAIKNIDLDLLKYEYSQGSFEFRNNLCNYYYKHKINIENIRIAERNKKNYTFMIDINIDSSDKLKFLLAEMKTLSQVGKVKRQSLIN